MAKLKGRAKQFAELNKPVSKAFDPEEEVLAEESEDNDSGESDDGLAGTEHYGAVGKSKLRQPDVGPQYAGSRISREALANEDHDEDIATSDEEEGEKELDAVQFADPDDSDLDVIDEDEDIDSEAAFGDSDVERFSGFTFRGSSQPAANGVRARPTASDFMSNSDEEEDDDDDDGGEGSEEEETDEDVLDADDQHREEQEDGSDASEDVNEKAKASEPGNSDDEDDEDDESESDSDNGDDEKARRAELRKIMNEEQTTVVAAISQAVKADADKGNAVKQQRNAFDSLLNVRIALQKALIATNTMTTVEENPAEIATDEPYQAAEDAALKLWNTLDRIRHEFIQTNNAPKPGQKRKRDVDSSTPSPAIWGRMQDAEVASLDTRRHILEKWWGKVKGSAPSTGKLIAAAPPPSITAAIHEQLSKASALEASSQPRSCAPVQERAGAAHDPRIYDDTSFYRLLLNQLVEQRKVDAGPGGEGAAAQWAVREVKTRKTVDTKASKGRKMRYTVHEKLQNFMAPEDRAGWEQEAIDRLFGTLLGQKMNLGEDAMEVDGEEEEISPEEAGLRLFRS